MKKRLTTSLLATTLLLFSMAALAVDSDGDGVDNTIDAFPNDGCATVDTDGDGLPDAIEPAGNCLIDGFETGNFSVNPWDWLYYPWSVQTGGRTGTYAARSGVNNTVLRLTHTFPVATTLVFYYKNKGSYFSFIGPGSSSVGLPFTYGTSWIKIARVIPAGTYILQWQSCSGASLSCLGHDFWLDDIGTTPLALDLDDDNDGVADTTDKFPLDPTETLDTDNDGVGNNADWDDDNDGVPDNIDAAPLNNANTSEIVLPLNGSYKGMRLENNAGQ